MTDASIPIAPRGAPLPLATQTPVPTPDRTLRGAPLPLAPQAAPANAHLAQARHAAEEFESVFLNEMLAPMFEGLSTDGLGGGGVGEEMFRPMLIDRYAQAITHAGGIGIADEIMGELTRMQTTQPSEDEPGNGPRR
jgi:flagellar protein FlgJ